LIAETALLMGKIFSDVWLKNIHISIKSVTMASRFKSAGQSLWLPLLAVSRRRLKFYHLNHVQKNFLQHKFNLDIE